MTLRQEAMLAFAGLLGLLLAWGSGYQVGGASVRAELAQEDAVNFRQLLAQSQAQLKDSQSQSASLFQRLASRARDDERTTQVLKDALVESAASRASCRFPVGVVQQLDAARQRAAEATTGGLGAALPFTSEGG